MPQFFGPLVLTVRFMIADTLKFLFLLLWVVVSWSFFYVMLFKEPYGHATDNPSTCPNVDVDFAAFPMPTTDANGEDVVCFPADQADCDHCEYSEDCMRCRAIKPRLDQLSIAITLTSHVRPCVARRV